MYHEKRTKKYPMKLLAKFISQPNLKNLSRRSIGALLWSDVTVNQNKTKPLTANVAQTIVTVKPRNIPSTKNMPPVGQKPEVKMVCEGLGRSGSHNNGLNSSIKKRKKQ
jgi:hypothetical protein